MRRNKLSIFLHLVWATWDRLPMITPEIERRLYREIRKRSDQEFREFVLTSLNGYGCDHVHVITHHANLR